MRNVRKWARMGAMLIALLKGGSRLALANYAPNIHAQDDLKTLRTSLMTFEGIHRRMPTKEEGLQALVANPDPANFRNWQKLMDEVPLDPWGHEYQYIPPAPEGIRDYGIYSLGKDGISISNGNDPDDINSWDTGRRRFRSRPRRMNSAVWIAIGSLCFFGSISWKLARRGRAKNPQ